MKRFKKLVAIEPVSMIPTAEKKLYDFAEEVILYDNVPAGEDEIVSRIGDADAVLLSYTSTITKEIMARCPAIRYIGMCCSLYSPESANVDILYAGEHGITGTGIRDYGDEGVVEYVISELARCLHGFGQEPWFGDVVEITGLKVGVVGLGKSGGMIADAMKFFGAEISYFARGKKPAAEAESLGKHKILFNTGLSPAWDEDAFALWIDKDNLCYCDTVGALGGNRFLNHPHVHCMNVSTGRTRQAFVRLSDKVLANIETYLKGE